MTHPLLANIATYGFAALAGDVLMQSLEGEGYDAQRTARYGLYHVLFTGTYRTAWLAMLGAVVPAAPLARAAVTKTALDCFVSTPLQHFAFISYMAAFDGCGWDGTLARCKRMMPKSVPTSIAFWTPCQLVTFSVVPEHLRVLFMNGASLGWNAILSGINQRHRQRLAAAAPAAR